MSQLLRLASAARALRAAPLSSAASSTAAAAFSSRLAGSFDVAAIRPSAWHAPVPRRAFSAQQEGSGAASEGAAAAGGEGAQQNGQAGGAAPADLEAQLKAVQTELADAKKKLKEAAEQKVYLMAEMENVRRIARADVDKARQYAAQPVAKGLLLAVDNLQMAVNSLPADKAAASGDKAVATLAEGVASTLKIFLKVLGEHGVAQFGAVGEKFDPNVHEAVAMLPAQAGQEANTVSTVLKTGFMFKDRVLRPAQVVVAVAAEAVDQAKAAAAATEGSSRSI